MDLNTAAKSGKKKNVDSSESDNEDNKQWEDMDV